MGGSLFLALNQQEIFKGTITCLSRNSQTTSWLKQNGRCNIINSIKDMPNETELILVSTPIHTSAMIAQEIGIHSCNALVSDLASTKKEVIPAFIDGLKGKSYLSSHPMCGSEKSGFDGAKKDLYLDKTVVLTPHDNDSKQHIQTLSDFWKNLGMKIVTLSPEEHDSGVAWVSHMPHVLIYNLMIALGHAENKIPDLFNIAGTGLKDISRLAVSNPELWMNIVLENKNSVLKALDGLQLEISKSKKFIEEGDKKQLQNYFGQAKEIALSKGLR